MEKWEIRTINDHQQERYKSAEKKTADRFMMYFSDILEEKRRNEKKIVKILDIGGASGYFALALKDYFSDIDCEIVVLDSTKEML
jgi:ubiquinone/menaquinone biosynthesis C-methylase UbiE